MSDRAEVEAVARQVAAQILVRPDWVRGVDYMCQPLRRIAEAGPRETVAAIAVRAETILRDIAAADPLTIARRYYDLLPRQPDHPLTGAVIAALSDAPTVMRMLRACGADLAVRKDDSGENFLAIHDLSGAVDMGDAFKTALMTAMTWAATAGPRPQGDLHTVH